MAIPQLKAKPSTSKSRTGMMSVATFTLNLIYALLAFVQTGSNGVKNGMR